MASGKRPVESGILNNLNSGSAMSFCRPPSGKQDCSRNHIAGIHLKTPSLQIECRYLAFHREPVLPWCLGISYTLCSSVTFHSGCCSSIYSFSQRGSVFQGLCGNVFSCIVLCCYSLLFPWPGTCSPSSGVRVGSLLGRNYHWHENLPCFPLLVL